MLWAAVWFFCCFCKCSQIPRVYRLYNFSYVKYSFKCVIRFFFHHGLSLRTKIAHVGDGKLSDLYCYCFQNTVMKRWHVMLDLGEIKVHIYTNKSNTAQEFSQASGQDCLYLKTATNLLSMPFSNLSDNFQFKM